MTERKIIPFKKPADPFTKEAKERWNKVPAPAQEQILKNVFCRGCSDSVAIILESATMQGRNLVIRGKCKVCGHEVCRLVEADN